MFRFPFRSANHRPSRKSRPMSYSSSYGRSSKKKSIPLLWILALIPTTFIGLELLLRVGVSVMGKEADLSGFGGEPSRISAYRMRPMTQDGQAIAGLSPGTLQVRSSGLTGYELVPNQSAKTPSATGQTEIFHINNQGLRAVEPVAIKKPTGDVRVLLLGSSTAFGTLSSANEGTIARSLETQLNQQVQDQKNNAKQFRPDVLPYFADEMEKALKLPPKIRPGQYRVINAAVPGYLTSNALSQLSNQLLDYQPDVVVLIDGYSDLLVKSNRSVATLGVIDQSLTNATGYFSSSLGQGLADLWNQLYLVKVTNAWVIAPNPKSELLADVSSSLSSSQGTLVDRLSEDSAEVEKRVDRRTRALEKMLQLTRSRKISLLVGLTPELSHRKSPTPNEKKLLDNLGDRYPKLIQAQYAQLLDAQKKLPGLTPVLLQDAVTSLTSKDQQAFVDAVHLTDNANAAIAKSLISAIAPTLYVEPKPYRAE